MKIFNKITIVTALLATMSAGCSDFLEEMPESQISADEFYNDASSAEIGLTGVYNRFFNEQAFPLLVTMVQVGTDDIKQPSGAFFQYKDRTQMLASNANATLWERMYRTVVNANFLIEQVEELPAEAFAPDTERKAEILAEARFVRAVTYYYLGITWGDVPLITEFPEDIQEAYVAKTDREQVMEFVKSELQYVANTLPDVLDNYSNDQVTNAQKGRASKWAAKAYLARLALAENDWQQALSLSNEIINSGIYSFTTPWRSIFQEPMNSSESIFEMQNDFSPGFFGSGIHGWFFGYDFEWSDAAIALYEKPEDIKEGQGKDVRFDLAYTPHAWSPTFSTNKYIPPRGFAAGGIESANILLLRLTEQFLNKAEALNEINFEANKEEVVEILNMVRARAEDPTWTDPYFPEVPVGTTGIPLYEPSDFETQAELREAIHEERRREFIFEDVIRWIDIMRWDKEYAMEITNSPTENHLYWPIPPAEIIRNPKLEQNPAYTK